MTTALQQYGLLTQWQLRRQSVLLPLLVVVQGALAVGTVLGFGILMGDLEGQAALYLATGAPTITLIVIGLVMAPQMLSQAKTEGSAQWMMTLPVPRLVFLAADLTVWTLVALPGTVLAVFVGVLRRRCSSRSRPQRSATRWPRCCRRRSRCCSPSSSSS